MGCSAGRAGREGFCLRACYRAGQRRLGASTKSLLRSSSRFLNHATVGLVYFKHVTINFPNTWPNRSSVRRLLCSFEISDARFDLPGSKVQERPFTTQWRPCGKPREYIQLTSP
ncbi:calcium-activated chloride channel regulator 1-like isoform X1 [Rhipicephalus microplus]|uniref:calcium-activated chloride channel regulator 1-like isoform X1 n=1 Tax=Rhipicephalus microplus TaxID=6941 RepID=UPI003F6AA805